MKKGSLIRKLSFKQIVITLMALLGFLYSCHKEASKLSDVNRSRVVNPEVAGAKSWYESAYPTNSTKSGKVRTNSTDSVDVSQTVKPDWYNSTTYKRLGKDVIEMPFDPGAKFLLGLKANNWQTDTAYTRSYYLFLNDGQTYEAFIMTIIADQDYINNDFSKLAHNTYRKHDADFSGMVLYSTPRGQFLGGYRYKNGQLIIPRDAERSVQNTGKKRTNQLELQCTDWYTKVIIKYTDGTSVVSQDWTYDSTICQYVDNGSVVIGGGGGGSTGGDNGGSIGGGGSTVAPPAPKVSCPTGSHPGPPVLNPCTPVGVESTAGRLNINVYAPPTTGGDGGMQPPPSQICSVDPPSLPCPAEHNENLLPKNKLCSSTFRFTTIVAPNQSQNSRGWKESSVSNLVINVVSDNYFENIWNVITTGSGVVSGNFNLEIGAPGDVPDQALIASTSWAANVTIAQLEKSYGIEGLKALIKSGTLGSTVAKLMQIQLQSEIPGSRVSSFLSGRTVPTSPVTGINCK